MNSTIITSILAMVQKVLPLITGVSPAVSTAIDVVTELTPIVVQEYQDLKPIVANIITALKSDPATNAAQLAALQKSEALLDAEFDAAAAAALQEDAAADDQG